VGNKYVSPKFATGEDFENYLDILNASHKGQYLKLVCDLGVDDTTYITFSRLNESSFVIDWGDGTIDKNTKSHTYASEGVYEINIYGVTSKTSLEQCKAIKSVVIGKGVDIITSMFSACERLENVTIEDGVTSIGSWAFRSCQFTHIEIPNSVTTFGSQAFGCCPLLRTMTFGSRLKDSNYDDAFYLTSVVKIYVPFECLEEYKAMIMFKDVSWALDALIPASSALGRSGTYTLAVSDWRGSGPYTFNDNFSYLGNNDAIFFSPSTATDKTNMEDANIFISSSGIMVSFRAETKPTADITLEYFIVKGM